MSLPQLLQSSPYLFIALCLVVGLMVGSFLNVVIYRLPKMLEREWREQCAEVKGEPVAAAARFNLFIPRSACPQCGKPITVLENIPLFSYLVLHGKCSGCGASIAKRYPLVEALSGVLSAIIAWRFGFGVTALAAMLFAWCMIALTFIDLDTQLLPDSITLPLLWCGLLFNLGTLFSDVKSAVIGATAGYLALWAVYWVFKWATGKEGMGYGDFKLLAAIGAWLGWQMLLPVILLSSFVGAAIGITLILAKDRSRHVPIPFGPYLAAAGMIALVLGQQLCEVDYIGTLLCPLR
ncbi:MAG TPA: A24 family peptidase [Burkholderiales bacterium]|nr:A24 family peptidase [Burkholderiales bacterium]